jgi:hypothetical protein
MASAPVYVLQADVIGTRPCEEAIAERREPLPPGTGSIENS